MCRTWPGMATKMKGMVEMRRMLQEKRWYDILEAEEVVKRIWNRIQSLPMHLTISFLADNR